MLFVDDLKPLFLYSNKRKMFIPINEKDKKHGSAIYLMSPSQEINEKMMNAQFLHSPQRLYRSLYIDRNVMTYIDSGATIEAEEEFDEVQESVLSEGMFHPNKTKFVFENVSTMDERILKTVFNDEALKFYLIRLGLKEFHNENIIVVCHSNIAHLRDSAPFKTKELFYSYTNKNEINVISKFVYDEKTMDGPYDIYLKHELVNCILLNNYPDLPYSVASATAMAISGQIEFLRAKKNKELFGPSSSDKEKIDNLYLADLIYDLYLKKGARALNKFLQGDTTILRSVATGRVLGDVKKLFSEAALSSKERNSLNDSEFGLPDKRKFPLNDEAHVRAAIKFFNKCDEEDKARLAKKIKSKMKQYNISTDSIGENNSLKKYITEATITIDAQDMEKIKEYLDKGYKKVPIRTSKVVQLVKEDATEDSKYPGLEYANAGYAFTGEHSEDYYAVLQILSTFTKEEFDRVSFNSTYKDSPYIEKRIVLRDNNNIPMSFMDVYHFPSDPERAQITTGVSEFYRGHHLCALMFKQLIDSGYAIENGIKKYIWHVHPGNDRSEAIAKSAGFIKGTEKLDKYGRMTYVYYIEKETPEFIPPMLSESSIYLNESASFIINEEVDNSTYDAKIRKYLYRERLKNARETMTLYEQIKSRNPKIDKTYRSLKFYKGLNLWVDTSYYHNLYLKNVLRNRDRKSMNMYFDFLNRLMDNQDINKSYNKITYFFSVHSRPDQTVDDLLNWNISLNPISVIAYFAIKDIDVLKRWKNKKIIFIGDNGYFTIDFGTFTHGQYAKFKRFITKIYTNSIIEDEDFEEDIIEDKSYKATSMEVIDKIANHLEINDVSALSNIKISHLSMEKSAPNLTPKNADSSAIMILSVDSNSVISELSNKSLKTKDIKIYYKPKM